MWTRHEREWLRRIIETILPQPDPEKNELSVTDRHLLVVLHAMPSLQAALLRGTLWLVLVWGGLAAGGLRPFACLDGPSRERAIDRLSSSRWYLVREMLVFLKLFACLVRELDPGFRVQVGWGEGQVVQFVTGRR